MSAHRSGRVDGRAQERDAALAEGRKQQTLVLKTQQELAQTRDLHETA